MGSLAGSHFSEQPYTLGKSADVCWSTASPPPQGWEWKEMSWGGEGKGKSGVGGRGAFPAPVRATTWIPGWEPCQWSSPITSRASSPARMQQAPGLGLNIHKRTIFPFPPSSHLKSWRAPASCGEKDISKEWDVGLDSLT